jgi:predicted nucleotidyltransferase
MAMGKLLEPLDAVLSSRSKVRLLRALLATAQPLSGREAARLAGVARVPAARSLNELVSLGIVERGESSRQHLYRINFDNELVQSGLAPLYSAERQRVDSVFDALKTTLAATPKDGGVLGAWIFGSAARGEDTAESDLDLLVAVADDISARWVHSQLAEDADEVERTFGLRLSPVVLTIDRLKEMADDGFGLVEDVRRDGRRVTGEDLERLLQ